MNAQQLVNYAFYLSGIVARDLEQVTAPQCTDGLFWLNQILAEMSITGRFIPYYDHPTFDMVIGQEMYFVPGLVELDAIAFTIQSVRFPLKKINRKFYFGAPRVNNITSLPASYYTERVVGGTNIYIYFLPVDNYTAYLTGRFSFPSNLTSGQDLTTLFDQFYISYLMYLLAVRLCSWYTIPCPPIVLSQLERLEEQLPDLNYQDLTISKLSTLQKNNTLGWAAVNFPGWTTTS